MVPLERERERERESVEIDLLSPYPQEIHITM